MARLDDIRVPISSVTKNITLHVEVTGLARWQWQLWIAMRLMRLAAWIAGFGIDFHRRAVERDTEAPPEPPANHRIKKGYG